MEVESSLLSRLSYFKKKKKKEPDYTEFPNLKKSWADSFYRLFAWEMSTFYNVEESDDEAVDDALTQLQEKTKEIVQTITRLEDYQKKRFTELKDFRADVVEKLEKLSVKPPNR